MATATIPNPDKTGGKKYRFQILDGVHVEEGDPIITTDDCLTCDGSGTRKNGLPCRVCVGPLEKLTDKQLADWCVQLGIEEPGGRKDMISKLKGKRIERTEVRYRARVPADPIEYQGDIIETNTDLAKTHNPRGCPPKFLDLSKDYNLNEVQRLRLELARYKEAHGDLPQGGVDSAPSYDGKSIAELVAIAEEREIDIPENSTRDQIVKLLK